MEQISADLDQEMGLAYWFNPSSVSICDICGYSPVRTNVTDIIVFRAGANVSNSKLTVKTFGNGVQRRNGRVGDYTVSFAMPASGIPLDTIIGMISQA